MGKEDQESGSRSGGFSSRLRTVYHTNGESCQHIKRADRRNMPPIPVHSDSSMPAQKRQRTLNPPMLDILEESSESDYDGYERKV